MIIHLSVRSEIVVKHIFSNCFHIVWRFYWAFKTGNIFEWLTILFFFLFFSFFNAKNSVPPFSQQLLERLCSRLKCRFLSTKTGKILKFKFLPCRPYKGGRIPYIFFTRPYLRRYWADFVHFLYVTGPYLWTQSILKSYLWGHWGTTDYVTTVSCPLISALPCS